LARSFVGLALAIAIFAAGPAHAEDMALCLDTADRVNDGKVVDDATRKAAHEACQRALADTSSIVQKYHLQEADFDIVGRPPKQ
jgi:putative N-acetylmannosamine-6-phosphate epimerase